MRPIQSVRADLLTVRTVTVGVFVSSMIAACGGGGGGSAPATPPPPTYTVGGTISGLAGSGLVLKDTVSGNQLTVPANATSFAITPGVVGGTNYTVAATAQPTNPAQICTVASPSGTVGTSNVTSVSVTCASTFTVGGTITGLTGTGLVLKDTVSGNQVTVPANATSFAITPAVVSGASYTVAASAQPTNPSETCTVAAPSGSVGTGNVTSVSVTCAVNTYAVGGTVSGLTVGGLVLKDTVSGNQVPVLANATSFTVDSAVNSGSTYAVTISAQLASSQLEQCWIVNGSGTVTSANVASVSVKCAAVGKFLWTTNPYDSNGDGSIDAFTIDPLSGALTAVAGFPAATNTTTDNQPLAIALDPSNPFIYVANNGHVNNVPALAASASLATDRFDTLTGVLTQDASLLSTGGTTNTPCAVAINATTSGTYLYVGSQDTVNGSSIGAYSLTGGIASAPLTGSPSPAQGFQCGLAVDSTQKYLFATSKSNVLGEFGINANGSLTTGLAGFTFASTSAATFGAATSPNGRFLYVTDNNANTVTALTYDNTGALALVSAPYAVGNSPEGIAIDPSGRYLYISNSGDGTVSAFSVNADGTLTAINSGTAYVSATGVGVPSTATPTSIAIDPSGQFLYAANGDAGTITPFAIGAGGALTPVTGGAVSTILAGGGPSSIAIK